MKSSKIIRPFKIPWIALVGWLTVATLVAPPERLSAQESAAHELDKGLTMRTHAALPTDALVAAHAVDANLNDLTSVTEDRLVAVGDRGMILISENGGRSWQVSLSHTTANLSGVAFASEDVGVAVGGWIGNYTGMSHAVVLRSTDGGRSWSAMACADLPRLIGIKMLGNRALAWGDFNSNWNTGLFESLDGGLTWHGIGTSLGHVSTADMTDSGTVGAVDRLGRAYFSTTGPEAVPATIAKPGAPLTGLHHTGQRWLACGLAGELIASIDGQQWFDVQLPLSPEARQLCSWQTIEQVGEEIWIGGFPGSLLLHSSDRGITWSIQKTGQRLPISAIEFVDRNRGWAAGPMGLILATRDGGQTWYAQRQLTQRLGVMAFAADQATCPWSPVVAVAWDEQVAAGMVVLSSDDPIAQSSFLPSPSTAVGDIAPRLGLACYTPWPSTSVSTTGMAQRAMVEILSWRPDVVITSDKHTGTSEPASRPSNAMFSVLQMCSSPDGTLNQELGLTAWSVKKLVNVTDEQSGQYAEQSRRILRNPGLSIWEILLPLPVAARDRAATTAMQTVWALSQAKAVSTSLLGGIPPSVETARIVSIQNIGNYQLVMGRVHREKSMEQLAKTGGDFSSLKQWTTDLEFILRTLPPREFAPLVYQLANQLAAPQFGLRRQLALQRLVAADVHGDAADWARLELLKCAASDERLAWERDWESKQLQLASESAKPVPVPRPNDLGLALNELDDKKLQHAVEPWNATPFGESPTTAQGGTAASPVVMASAQAAVPPATSDGSRAQLEWFEMIDRANRVSPTLRSRPDLELLWYRVKQRYAMERSQAFDSGSSLEKLIHAPQLVGWPQMAQQELLLSANQIDKLRWTAFAISTNQSPLLDGQFNETFWHAMPAMSLKPLVAEPTASPITSNIADNLQPTIRWAYDDKYLYVGIDCPRTSNVTTPPLIEQRTYDSDLSGVDHIQFTLDTDRDYNSAIEMAVSEDGRTYDRCCGFSEYNPKWHVCVKPQTHQWTAEIAIELQALTSETRLAGSAWAISARRFNPRGTSQSWSQLRTHEPLLQASGLLLFLPAEEPRDR